MTAQNGLLIFLGKETHSENKIMEVVEDFVEKSYNNNGKPWKSLRNLRVDTKTAEIFSPPMAVGSPGKVVCVWMVRGARMCSTCGRGAGTHGDVLNLHTETFFIGKTCDF